MNNESAELATTEQPESVLPASLGPVILDGPTPDLLVIAEEPGEMQAAKSQLIAWAQSKVSECSRAVEAGHDALQSAKDRRSELAPYRAVLRSAQADLDYFTKMSDALEAGYFPIPNMPIEIIAVRISSTEMGWMKKTESTYRHLGVSDTRPEVIASGEGEYVNPQPKVQHGSYGRRLSDGKTENVYTSQAISHRDPKFPIIMRKPRVLDAANRALALKVFDQIGILPSTKRQDPMLVGQVLRKNGRITSFLIAWWIDTRDL